MGNSPTIPYAPEPWTDTKAEGSSSVPSSPDPVTSQLTSMLTQSAKQVAEAEKKLSSMPQYSSQSSAQPVMPVDSYKAGLFKNASASNLKNVQPQTTAGARSKGIGMIAGAAAQLIGGFVRKKEAEKTQALAQDINRSLELTKGLQEAKDVLATDPNNAQAKMAVKKNEALLNALVNGKNGKAIGKAFGVTFGPEAQEAKKKKANDPNVQAMQAALKQHQEEDRLKAFEENQPQRMGQNPLYAQKAAEVAQAQKAHMELTKSIAPILDTITRTNAEAERTQAKIESTEKVAKEREEFETDKFNAEEKNKFKLRELSDNAMLARTQLEGANRMRELNRTQDATKRRENATTLYKTTDSDVQKLQADANSLAAKYNALDEKAKKDGSNFDTKMLKTQLDATNKLLKEKQDQLKQYELMISPDGAAVDNLLSGMRGKK